MVKVTVKDDSDSGEDPGLVAKVDEMMDPDLPAVKAVESPVEPSEATDDDVPKISRVPNLPPLDIFADTKGAPLLTKTKAKPKIVNDIIAKPKAEPIPLPDSVATEDDPTNEDNVPEPTNPSPDNFDDPNIAQAIDDIVAHEGDTVLQVEDYKLANQRPIASAGKSHGHPVFWTLIVILCLIAIALAVYLLDPSIHNPFRHFHWSSISSHL